MQTPFDYSAPIHTAQAIYTLALPLLIAIGIAAIVLCIVAIARLAYTQHLQARAYRQTRLYRHRMRRH